MLFGGSLYHGGLFAGALFGPDGTTPPPVSPPSLPPVYTVVGGSGGGGRGGFIQTWERDRRYDVWREKLERDEEDVMMTILSCFVQEEDPWG